MSRLSKSMISDLATAIIIPEDKAPVA